MSWLYNLSLNIRKSLDINESIIRYHFLPKPINTMNINVESPMPRLSFHSAQRSEAVLRVYDKIKRIPFCWLAEEELESNYPQGRISDTITFTRKGNTIRFIQWPTDVVAEIVF